MKIEVYAAIIAIVVIIAGIAAFFSIRGNSSGYVGDKRFPTEDSFTTHFNERVAPWRKKLLAMTVGEIPENERARANFVVAHGTDAIDYYQARLKLTPYGREQLDKYVERQYR